MNRIGAVDPKLPPPGSAVFSGDTGVLESGSFKSLLNSLVQRKGLIHLNLPAIYIILEDVSRQFSLTSREKIHERGGTGRNKVPFTVIHLFSCHTTGESPEKVFLFHKNSSKSFILS